MSLLHKSCALALLAALSLGCGGRSHDLEEGLYALTAESVSRDDCGRLSASTALFTADLVIAGNTVRLKNALYGMQLVGAYLSNVEQFQASGSVGNQLETLRGAECFLDLMTVSLEGASRSPTEFTGTARLRYEARTDACSCEVWTTYRAVKQ
jgi:hypothetical protein